ncbi:hypothetical protein GGC65_002082 [Sphingopyxis sp. OAS728]|uniref:hypothetical protein n=1 Tax=Sphingopyxis sp. OAS728 TaxID=2663823 RepID=UPI00178B1570|nr:hypothetical protein [Sphingopyxis sp. OAS728]MBE1527626.1 hypothetical protein [Sphingopyxis sp. OAS728]
MMARRIDARRDAPALRFLLLCVGGWIVVRVMMSSDLAPPPTPDPVSSPWSVPSTFAATDAVPAGSPTTPAGRPIPPIPERESRSPALTAMPALAVKTPSAAKAEPTGLGADRHGLRLALFARLLPAPPGGLARSAVAGAGPLWFPLAPTASADPGQGKPFWIQRQLGGWALAGWLYLREGSGNASEPIGAASQLGGSQAGLRLGYGFGDTGRARAYGRATIAVQRPQQREVAFGLAFAPLAHLPVDVAIEQRIAAGKEGRTALAIMASGGVSEVALPAGFRLDAYAQAGVVGARRRDGFADAAIVVDRRIGADDMSPLRLGALAAGAVQPGAARVDVGPRVTLRLPEVGEGSRIALDWRQRVAGDARPESGLALTLASDF